MASTCECGNEPWFSIKCGDSVQRIYSQYVTKEALERFGDFKIGQVICTVIYAGDPMLLANEEKVIQGAIDRIIEI
jgi:hypothetical protein